jgi:murein DD-endopeptidase MepM/ murein hydrolase activator NlpD
MAWPGPRAAGAAHVPAGSPPAQPLLIVPPLLPPLVLRTETGFFGAKRFGPGEFDRCRPCTRFEAPPSPPPPPPVRYLRQQVHEGVDLEGEAGDCVFAAYMGRVVEVEAGAGGTRGNVTIDHHPFGTGLVSSYLHLEGGSLCVEEGEVVTKGQVIGRIGPGPEDPHLHFALRIVIDPSDSRYWADRSSVALDPTRLLYRLEADELPVLPAGERRP